MLIFMFNSMAALTIGDFARFTEEEYRAISEPLERLMRRMPGETADKFGKWADPLMLLMGLSMWGFRVFVQIPRVQARQRAAAVMAEMEKSMSRDGINLDPTQPAAPAPAPPRPSEQTAPQAGMKAPAPPTMNGNADTIPTGIRPDFQNLWEQPLDD
jgi:hypothetical protein